MLSIVSLSASIRRTLVCSLLLASALGVAPAHAQPGDSPQPESPDVTVGPAEMRIGALVQTQYLANVPGGTSGFSVRNARLAVRGSAGPVNVLVQTEFVKRPALLDMSVKVPLSDRVTAEAGLYKTYYSRELIAGRDKLLFLERARVVNALSPRRQVGVGLIVEPVPGLTAIAGVYNGNGGRLIPNDNDAVLALGRLNLQVPVGADGELGVGVNGGYSEDESVQLKNTVTDFAGQRLLLGADAELLAGRWTVTAEAHAALLTPNGLGASQWARGAFGIVGLQVAPQHQVLTRLDVYDPEGDVGLADAREWGLGYTYTPYPDVRTQVNVLANETDLADPSLGLRLEVGL